MIHALKRRFLARSPESVRSFWGRVEASPLGYRLAKGAFWSMAGALISRSLGLLSAILVGRMLGKEGFGELGIIQNTIGMFGTLAGFGMGATANKHVAEFKRTDPARAGRIIAMVSTTAWISSGIMAVVLFACAPWLAAKTLAAPQLSGMLEIGALLLFLSGVNGAQLGALSGFEAFRAIARINLICGVLTFPLMVAGAWYWGVAGAVWGLIGSQLANCLLCYAALRSEATRFGIPIKFAGALAESKLFWSFSVPAVLIGLLNSIVGWGAGALVVNQIGGYADMGAYNAVTRIKTITDALLSMVLAPIIPILSDCFGRSDQKAYRETLRYYLMLSTVIVVPISLLQTAAPALTLLPFGPEYRGHHEIVVWLMLHSVLASVGTSVGYIFVTMGRMWLVWLFGLGFAVSYACVSLWLVPLYGATGYAASQAIAYGLATVPGIILLYIKFPEVMRYMRWGMIASVCLGLFVICSLTNLWTRFSWSVAVGALAAVIFLTMIWRFRSRIALKAEVPIPGGPGVTEKAQ